MLEKNMNSNVEETIFSMPSRGGTKRNADGAAPLGHKNAAKIAKIGVLFAASAAEHDEQNDVATDQVRALCRCLPHFDT